MGDQNNSVKRRFTDILGNLSIRNYVEVTTHSFGHILDLELTNELSSLNRTLHLESVITISEFQKVLFKLKLGKKEKLKDKMQFRRIISLTYETFNYVNRDLSNKLNEGTCRQVQAGLECVDCRTESYKTRYSIF